MRLNLNGAGLCTWLAARAQQPIGLWLFALGALMTLGFAPFFFWPLSLLSLAGLIWLVTHARNRKQAAAAALVWGMGHQLTALYWLPRAFYLDAGRDWVAGALGGVPALLGLAFYGALGVAAVATLARTAPRPWRAPVFVLAWVALDMLKSLTPYGFPWLPPGAVWAGDMFGLPVMAQLASVGGVFLLSALVLTVAATLSFGGARAAASAALVLLAVAGFGAFRLTTAETDVAGTWVRMVQPNVQSPLKWDPEARLRFLQMTIDTAFDTKGPGGTAPAVVILPETAIAFPLGDEPELRLSIAARMDPAQTLLSGTFRQETAPGQKPRFFNSFSAMSAEGMLLGSYDKRLLVPFGEFIPARGLLEALPLPGQVRTLSQSRMDYSFGTRDPRLATPAGVMESMICYEGIFPWFVARHSEGADMLVNVTNDNWFTGTTALFQHAALARLRAIETGIPLIRVANTGLTLAFDGYGNVLGTLPINTMTHLDVHIPDKLRSAPLFRRIVAGF